MMKQVLRFFLPLAAVIVSLASCDSDIKDVQRINTVEFSPQVMAEDVNLKYTDSGKVKAILVSPLMLDFNNLRYGFNEFPKGVHVTLVDESGKNSYVESDYAINYADTDLIDLQGNVKITSSDGKVLETEQLYYDQKNEWFYTEKYFKLYDAQNGSYLEGPGIDFSKDFKVVNTQRNRGEANDVDSSKL